ncbi:MAG TPA: GNAT family N-acetyltransferase [Xanthobacteraceae bacterium]|nr:GNAT family N-acetyltransferase [Xanthobacteraceae bacterium]
MSDAASHSVVETLRSDKRVEIRALRPEDRAPMLAAVGRVSAQSLYRRFFSAKRHFTEQEASFFLNVDFVNHVALVAVIEEDGRPTIVGGGRYVVTKPGQAEVAFAIIDKYQGQGIGAVLMRHLAEIARAAGLRELVAEVLPENTAMLRVFENSGLPISRTTASGAVHVELKLTQPSQRQ